MNTFFNIKNIVYSLIGLLIAGSLTCCKKQQAKISKGNILVLDGYKTKQVYINDDSVPDASHGKSFVRWSLIIISKSVGCNYLNEKFQITYFCFLV